MEKQADTTEDTKPAKVAKVKKPRVKKAKRVKVDLRTVAPKDRLNDEGRFTDNPFDLFNRREHVRVTKDDFDNEADFMLFRADMSESSATRAIERAQRQRDTAQVIRACPDGERRKALLRKARLEAQLAKLEEALDAESM